MSEGNVNDLSTGLKAIDLVPEVAAVGSEIVSEAPNIKDVPISRDNELFTHWIRKFMPTGYEVVVDLPYLPDSRCAMFLIKCSPMIMPLVPADPDWWVAQKNYEQFVRHDVFSNVPGTTDYAVADIPPGIFINQITDPPPIAMLAANHRFWQGKINFHIRVVGNFNQAGYIRTTKLRQVAIPMAVYDRYSKCPIPQKSGTFGQAGFFNSYTRSDVTMFRHQELTVPYEKITPVDNLDRWNALYNGVDIYDNIYDQTSKTWKLGQNDTSIIVPQYEDYIAVEAVGALAGSQQDAQLRFIIEIAAGDDFNLFAPLPLSNYFFDPQSKYFDQEGHVLSGSVHNSDMKIPDTLPDRSLTSDGQSTITEKE